MTTEDNADTAEDSTAGSDKPAGNIPATPAAEGDKPDADQAETDDELDGAKPEDLRRKAETWREMARKHEKENRRLLAAEAERQQAELSELDRAKADADTAKAEALELRRRLVAAEHGLPPELGNRLQGDTEDELVEDAKRLAELVPPAKPPTPSAADVGIGTAPGEPSGDPMELHRQFTAGGPNPPA